MFCSEGTSFFLLIFLFILIFEYLSLLLISSIKYSSPSEIEYFAISRSMKLFFSSSKFLQGGKNLYKQLKSLFSLIIDNSRTTG